MALRWLSSRQSAWGSYDETPNMARRLFVGGVGILLVGTLIGVGIGALVFRSTTPGASNSLIATPSLSDMKTAPKTPDGAVRAVTSYITGFPSVSLASSAEQKAVLDDVVAPNADPNLRSELATTLVAARSKLVLPTAVNGQVSARLVTTPASYKVSMLSPDRARVQVWFLQVLVDASSKSVHSTWSTNDVQVQWSDHWRLATFVGTGGPTPPLFSDNSAPSSYDEVINVFNGFTSYRYATSQSTPSNAK